MEVALKEEEVLTKFVEKVRHATMRAGLQAIKSGVATGMKAEMVRLSKESTKLRRSCLKLVEQNEMLKKGLEEIDNYAKQSKCAAARLKHVIAHLMGMRVKRGVWRALKQQIPSEGGKAKALARERVKEGKVKERIWREWRRRMKG